MSVDYAAGLSDYDDLGVCGLDEVFDTYEIVEQKVKLLREFLQLAGGSCVVHVGAGISTSAGISDFRGFHGVWTRYLRDKKKKTQNESICDNKLEPKAANVKAEQESSKKVINFDETEPTITHMMLKDLCEKNLIKHIISQNVDGLFLKCNLNRKYLSELHGNFYLDECKKCHSRYIRPTASKTMRLQTSDKKCLRVKNLARCKKKSEVKEEREIVDDEKKEEKIMMMRNICNGFLRDTILDWESSIPYNELKTAKSVSKKCKLHICIGTTLQLNPARELVCRRKTNQRKLVIINLQPTKFDKDADLIINYYSDDVMKELANQMNFEISKYNSAEDPTRNNRVGSIWTKKD